MLLLCEFYSYRIIIVIIEPLFITYFILIIRLFVSGSQCNEFCIQVVDHVWQGKLERAAAVTLIAATVKMLDAGYRPALRNGWLANINKAYPAGGTTL